MHTADILMYRHDVRWRWRIIVVRDIAGNALTGSNDNGVAINLIASGATPTGRTVAARATFGEVVRAGHNACVRGRGRTFHTREGCGTVCTERPSSIGS